MLEKDAKFCLQVARIAIQRMLEGYGYELPGIAVIDAYTHFLRAAAKLGVTQDARKDVFSMATKAKQGGAPFAYILILQCSSGSPQ